MYGLFMDIINLAWWNVGISPPILKKTPSKDTELKRLREMLLDISVVESIDFFVFCEVSTEQSDFLKSIADELNLEFVDLTGRDGRLVMDMSLMYETSKLEYISHKNINDSDGTGNKKRVGIKVLFKESKGGQYVTFFLSHWNSERSATDKDRVKFSSILRREINEIFSKFGTESYIVLLGDYNSQPYSYPIQEILETTKDYILIQEYPKKNKLLFNPFWKCISNNKFHSSGSYYLEHGEYDRWYAFDQMMFSSSFIINNRCTCNNNLRIDLDSFKYYSMFDFESMCMHEDFLKHFDHAPIFGRLYYE